MGSLTEALSIVKTPQLRDVSFSSYLNPSEEAFLKKLVETSKIPNSTITIQKDNVFVGKNKIQDGEIGVFGAEKYFNEETIDHQDMKYQQNNCNPSIVKEDKMHCYSERKQARSPSVHSQSSWNSQSALLQSGRKNSIDANNAKRKQGKSLLSTLSCNCYCGDTNSIDIGELKSESSSKRNFREEVDLSRTNKSLMMEEMHMKKNEDLRIELNKKDCFTFPISYSKPSNLETKLVSQKEENENIRKSIEVFGSPILEKRKESIFPERKQDLFTLDDDFEKDFDSDASSDLFEIDSFSITNKSNPYLLRQASNVSSCVTPTTCYAPSEASIEWSVVTASVADFSSVSDPVSTKSSIKAVKNESKTTTNGKEEVEKRRSGILYGCRSQKATRVAGDAYRTNKKLASDGHNKIVH